MKSKKKVGWFMRQPQYQCQISNLTVLDGGIASAAEPGAFEYKFPCFCIIIASCEVHFNIFFILY